MISRLKPDDVSGMTRGYSQARKSKYRNVRGNGYASRKEARRATELAIMQAAGEITDLEEQPRFELIPKQQGERAAHYVADFQYRRDGQLIVEDVKSPCTRKLPVYALKRKLMLKVHGIRLVEV